MSETRTVNGRSTIGLRAEMPAENNWIDISVPVDPETTPLWPGSSPIRLERELSLKRGDPVNDTTLSCSVHTGTHLDAPAHFHEDGKTVDLIQPDILNGRCEVVSLRGVELIGEPELLEALSGKPSGLTERILLLTDNSVRWSPEFDEDFVGLSPDAARWIADQGIRLLGIDYLSVQPYEGSDIVHQVLLDAEVVLLEGINLSRVDPGTYQLLCLPLKLQGVEAAPARALLRPWRRTD